MNLHNRSWWKRNYTPPWSSYRYIDEYHEEVIRPEKIIVIGKRVEKVTEVYVGEDGEKEIKEYEKDEGEIKYEIQLSNNIISRTTVAILQLWETSEAEISSEELEKVYNAILKILSPT